MKQLPQCWCEAASGPVSVLAFLGSLGATCLSELLWELMPFDPVEKLKLCQQCHLLLASLAPRLFVLALLLSKLEITTTTPTHTPAPAPRSVPDTYRTGPPSSIQLWLPDSSPNKLFPDV